MGKITLIVKSISLTLIKFYLQIVTLIIEVACQEEVLKPSYRSFCNALKRDMLGSLGIRTCWPKNICFNEIVENLQTVQT